MKLINKTKTDHKPINRRAEMVLVRGDYRFTSKDTTVEVTLLHKLAVFRMSNGIYVPHKILVF